MNYYLTLATILFVYMSLWFMVSVIQKRNDIADVAWGLGFVLISWVSFFTSSSFSWKALLVCVLVTIWGFRLAWHIHRRHKGKAEDFRYAKWRTDWGKWFYVRSFLQVYLLQGTLLFLVVFPVLILNKGGGGGFSFLDVLGLCLWVFGFLFEVIGDAQLARFIANPEQKGKLMQSGLWQYTRHPNYFGEVTQWWGVWLLALSSPAGLMGIIGPLTITFLILKVSGVPLLEQKMALHPDFPKYQRQTNMFFPWLPKR